MGGITPTPTVNQAQSADVNININKPKMDDDVFILCSLAAVSALLIAHSVLKRKRKLRRKRTVWIRSLFKRRAEFGATHTLLRELTASSVADDAAQTPNPYSFRNYTRMDLATYENLFAMIESRITGSSYFRKPISAAEKFAVTLRYLATGLLRHTLLIFNVWIKVVLFCSRYFCAFVKWRIIYIGIRAKAKFFRAEASSQQPK